MINKGDFENLIFVDSVESKQNEDPYANAVNSFKSLLGSLNYTPVEIEELYINSDSDYMANKHILLTGYYLTVHYKNNKLYVLTEFNKFFIIDMLTVGPSNYREMFDSLLPYKLCCSGKDLFLSVGEVQGLFDLSLVIKMYFGKKESLGIQDIIGLFFNTVPLELSQQLHCLYLIKNKLVVIIERYRLMSGVNMEMALSKVIYKCEEKGLPFSKEKHSVFIKNIKKAYEEYFGLLKESIGEFPLEEMEFLDYLKEKDHFPTTNIDYLNLLPKEDFLLGYMTCKNILQKNKENNISKKIKNNRLMLSYTSYSDFGKIQEDIKYETNYIYSDEYLVCGVYEDLFYRLFMNFIRSEELSDIPRNTSLISFLSSSLFEEQNATALFTTKVLLDSLISGSDSLEKNLFYFNNIAGLLLESEDVEELIKQFENKFPETLSKIMNFENRFSKGKKVAPEGISPLHDFLSHTRADIYKMAILFTDKMVVDYNKRNKGKIQLVGVSEDRIILECGEDSLNTGMDILNRTMERAYNFHAKKVPALFSVSSSKQLKIKE